MILIAQEMQVPKVSGYSEAGASKSKRAFRAFNPRSSSPNEDIIQNLSTLRQRSRMLYMSSSVATAAINTQRTHVIGVGLTLQSSVDREILGISEEEAKHWQHRIEAEFRLWADTAWNCDAIGLNNFGSMQQLALSSWLQSGDVFPLIVHDEPTPMNPYGLRIHLIEADRICTPSQYGGTYGMARFMGSVIPQDKPGAGNTVYDGVEVDSSGRIVAYHICNEYPNSCIVGNSSRKWARVPVRGDLTGLPNILHVMSSERCDQYRGVPYLAQVLEPLLQLRRYTDSEMMAALIQSFFTAFVETEADPNSMPMNEVGMPGENPDGVSQSENEYELGPGTVNVLKPGEKVQFGNPNIPTAGFETFVKTMCKLLGAALEIPYDVLIKEFNSSYSASRGALMEAWEAFKMRRKWFVDDFCKPIYELFVTEAVARGRIKAPGFFIDPLIRKAWCGASWIGPVQIQLDPVKEAKASVTQMQHGIKTHTQVTREQGGGDWEANVEQLKYENELLAKANKSGSMMPNTTKSNEGGEE